MTTHDATIGRFYDDFVVGDVYQHPFGRTITEADNVWLTNLTLNTNQNHFNAHFAAQNPITDGKVIVNSGLTIAMVLGLSVFDMSQNAIANLEMTDVRLLHPVYVGDTLYAESVCTDARRSASRDYAGIISMVTRGLNQEGTTISTWKRSVMISTRESGIGQGFFPESNESVSDYLD